MVRRNVGYQRHEGELEAARLNERYRYLRLYTNFFQPVLKLVSKERDGARVRKKYDTAQTPYQRVLAAARLAPKQQAHLQREYDSLNPAELKWQITRLQNELLDLAIERRAAAEKWAEKKPGRGLKKTPPPPSAHHPWRKAWSKKTMAALSKA